MSTSSADLIRIASRYSAALFSLASEKKQLDAVKKDLNAVQAALDSSDAFTRLLGSPITSRADQAKAVDAVLASMKAGKLTRDFFRTLAENRRLEITPWVVKQYHEKLMEGRGEIVAQVTSAHALSSQQLSALKAALKKATGSKEVHLEADEDPSILGGVIVKAGGKMFDNSVATKISSLASAMKAGVQTQ